MKHHFWRGWDFTLRVYTRDNILTPHVDTENCPLPLTKLRHIIFQKVRTIRMFVSCCCTPLMYPYLFFSAEIIYLKCQELSILNMIFKWKGWNLKFVIFGLVDMYYALCCVLKRWWWWCRLRICWHLDMQYLVGSIDFVFIGFGYFVDGSYIICFGCVVRKKCVRDAVCMH